MATKVQCTKTVGGRLGWMAIPLLGGMLWIQHPAPALAAEDAIDKNLATASDALGRDTLDEADQLFTQITNTEKASRRQRATAFAGRCAVRYKMSLTNKNPAMIPQAINDCDRAIELKSDMQQAWRIRGVALLSAGHPDRAAEDLNVAVALHPDDYLAFQNRALALVKLGRSQEAMAELDAAIRLKPDHPWSYYNRGRLHVTQGNCEAAIDDFISFIRFKRDHEEVYRLRGQCRLLLGLPQQAIGDFYESLRLKPANNPDALLQRGIAFALLERFVEAEQDLATALPLAPGSIETRLWLFLVRERLGKPGKEVLSDPAVRLDASRWPDALAAVFQGDLPAEKGVEIARQNDDPVEARKRENLTLLLLGNLARIKNHPDEATRWLAQIKNGSGREAPYFRTAQQELRQVTARTPAGRGALPYPPPSPRSPASTAVKKAPAEEKAQEEKTAPPVTKAEAPKPPPEEITPAKTRKEPALPARTQVPPGNSDTTKAEAPKPPPEEITPAKAKKEPARPARTQAPTDNSDVPTVRATARGPGEATPPQARPPRPPATEATATAPNVNPKDLQGKYAFKVASYTNAAFATNALAHYGAMGIPVFMEQGLFQGKNYQRIWVGPFTDEAQATAARERIRSLPNQNPTEVVKK
ncbi:MAG: tetratricopeptide repeat protein [Magnetococcales bacterium]|nr:tetratricopeptide repeat protein [Magnetococcales bacterium]